MERIRRGDLVRHLYKGSIFLSSNPKFHDARVEWVEAVPALVIDDPRDDGRWNLCSVFVDGKIGLVDAREITKIT